MISCSDSRENTSGLYSLKTDAELDQWASIWAERLRDDISYWSEPFLQTANGLLAGRTPTDAEALMRLVTAYYCADKEEES